jgi:hypothetical protein
MTTALCLKRRRRGAKAAKIPTAAMYYCLVFLPLCCVFPVFSFYVSTLRRTSYRKQCNEKEDDNRIFRICSSRDNDARTWTQQRSTGSIPSATSVTSSSASSNRAPFNRQHNRVESYPQRRQKMKPMPVTGYDARAIEDYYDMRPLEVGWRLNSLGFPLLGMAFVC